MCEGTCHESTDGGCWHEDDERPPCCRDADLEEFAHRDRLYIESLAQQILGPDGSLRAWE
jgi:hypothetical protein